MEDQKLLLMEAACPQFQGSVLMNEEASRETVTTEEGVISHRWGRTPY
jgi:hypothetical protein